MPQKRDQDMHYTTTKKKMEKLEELANILDVYKTQAIDVAVDEFLKKVKK